MNVGIQESCQSSECLCTLLSNGLSRQAEFILSTNTKVSTEILRWFSHFNCAVMAVNSEQVSLKSEVLNQDSFLLLTVYLKNTCNNSISDDTDKNTKHSVKLCSLYAVFMSYLFLMKKVK